MPGGYKSPLNLKEPKILLSTLPKVKLKCSHAHSHGLPIREAFSGHPWKHLGRAAGPGTGRTLSQARAELPAHACTPPCWYLQAGPPRSKRPAGAGRTALAPPSRDSPSPTICGEMPVGRPTPSGRVGPAPSALVTPDGHFGSVPTPRQAGRGKQGAPAPLLSPCWGGGRQGQADSAGVGEGTVAPGLRSTYSRVISGKV